LPHLDRPFDYAVPEAMSAGAQPGVRVRVRFAGRDVDAFVVERLATSEHVGRLSPLRRLVSAEPVLTTQVLALARAVADRYAGSLGDVLRLAVPPRHAATEKRTSAEKQASAERTPDGDTAAAPTPEGLGPAPSPWAVYPAGPALLSRIATGQAPRAVWTATAGPSWAAAVAVAALVAATAGRGAVVVLPDRRDVDAVEAAVLALAGPGRHVRLEADLGPAERYRAFLACLRGQVRIAIGTRAAAYAPVADLGLVLLWDDGDDQHDEPRAPYPHSRVVLALRAEQSGAAYVVGGWTVSVESAALLADGWARPVEVARQHRRGTWARVEVADDKTKPDDGAAARARIPASAWRAVQQGLTRGPVLVQVPRAGYLPALACQTCRRAGRCPACAGPLRLAAAEQGRPAGPTCGWCARPVPAWTCPHCDGRVLRALQVGVHRTAEELGRAFPNATVVVSRPERQLPSVGAEPAIVLATPGIEPVAEAGYAAAVLLDGDLLLARPDLRAGEAALRRWRAAVALVVPELDGGRVVVCADPGAPAVQALVRGDPAGYATRELAERQAIGLPPAVTAAGVTGPLVAVTAVLAALELPPATVVNGPVPLPATLPVTLPVTPAGELWRTVLRVPVDQTGDLSRRLHAVAAARSARRQAPVRIQVDPRDLG
jgi:primosomal protein N' (replication factor Y) (superfamily II helicase)